MARVTIVFEDDELGELCIEATWHPDLPRRRPDTWTPAQVIAQRVMSWLQRQAVPGDSVIVTGRDVDGATREFEVEL